MDNERLRECDAIADSHWHIAAPPALDDPYIGHSPFAISFSGLNVNPLVHSRSQIARQLSLNCIAQIGYEPMMNVTPELLEIRVDSGKWAAHDKELQRSAKFDN
jgi:hypothetical protein